MMREEQILPYKLERHLAEVCNNEAYANLLSVWNINKKMCHDVLSTVVMNYPHYTKHDITHCEAIITNIEMLLGEEAIRVLSPTDTWLLLHAAYLHDLGMVIECRKIEDNWESAEFQEYLHELEDSEDDSLAENAKFINSLGVELGKKENVMAWPVRVRYAVTLLIADYYRRKHAEDSKSYIKDFGSVFHIDFGFNGLIQQRLITLLADIVYLHTESSQKILELDYQTNGYNADYAHPRFLAQMLRMGDLLDADNNRFNTANETVFGRIPDSSKNHWEKHLSARHILVTPNVIEYRADCGKVEVYRETRVFLSWLKEEIEFWTFHWKNIMPKAIKGNAPTLGKCELLLNGVPDIQGLSDLRFSISPERAFEVIEGSNIYEDHFVFLREVIQNALDACKLQLWRDISEKRYRSWVKEKDNGELQPYEIKKEVFGNYKVEVRLYNYDENHFKIVIKDNGIGMSVEQLKRICDVGVSYLGDKRKKQEINGMPLWLRPTAGFGIGLQSIFLIADEFEIYSKSSVEEGIYARVTSRRRNGYVQVSKSNALKSQGTEIHIIVSRDINFKYGIESNAYHYIEECYDPFSAQKNLLYYKIWDILRETVEDTYFPIELYFDGEWADTIVPEEFERLQTCSPDKRYVFRMEENCRMELWDNKTYTKMYIRLCETYQFYNNRFYFKGMEIQNNFRMQRKGLWLDVDFYGLDTKKTLTLDRKRIKQEALNEINDILKSALDFFMDNIEKTLMENKKERSEAEYNQIYVYWCMVSLEKKLELLRNYAEVFHNVHVPVTALKKQENESFVKQECDFKSVLSDLDKMAVVFNLEDYIENKSYTESVNDKAINSMLSKGNIPYSTIIIDKDFTEALTFRNSNTLMIISDDEDRLCLMTFSEKGKELLKLASKETKDYLLRSLLLSRKESRISHLYETTVRRYIAGFKEYAALCTKTIPFGVGGEWYSSAGNVISPITVPQWENAKHLEKDKFVEHLCSKEEFFKLVDYVNANQVEEGKYSKEEIIGKYKDFLKDIYIANKHPEA